MWEVDHSILVLVLFHGGIYIDSSQVGRLSSVESTSHSDVIYFWDVSPAYFGAPNHNLLDTLRIIEY